MSKRQCLAHLCFYNCLEVSQVFSFHRALTEQTGIMGVTVVGPRLSMFVPEGAGKEHLSGRLVVSTRNSILLFFFLSFISLDRRNLLWKNFTGYLCVFWGLGDELHEF